MNDTTPKRATRSRIVHGIHTPPGSPDVKETTLRGHLKNSLDGLPQDLPTYYHEALLDDLCFLLRSPLLLYAISPRIRRGKPTPATSPNKTTTTPTPINNNLRSKVAHNLETGLDMSNLRMEIKYDRQGWATRLLYNTATLVEGCEYLPPKNTGFIPSFRFFCEEAEFLSYEFRAREHAAAVACGMTVDDKARKSGTQSPMSADEKKKRRLVKLKIRFKMARGRARRITK